MNAIFNRPTGRGRLWAAATIVLGFALLAAGCAEKPGVGQDFFSNVNRHAYLAKFSPSDFHHPTVITNPYYPLVVGAVWRWKGEYRNPAVHAGGRGAEVHPPDRRGGHPASA